MDQPTVSEIRTRLLVCTTCRADGEPALPLDARAGARLFATLSAIAHGDPAIDLVPVECLSVCKRPCTVSLSAPGKWTYVYGDLPPDDGAAIILDAAKLYAATSDGLIPWKLRVDAIKKGVVARLPPLPDPATARDAVAPTREAAPDAAGPRPSARVPA